MGTNSEFQTDQLSVDDETKTLSDKVWFLPKSKYKDSFLLEKDVKEFINELKEEIHMTAQCSCKVINKLAGPKLT